MKFTYDGTGLVLNTVLDKWNQLGERVVNKELEVFFKPIAQFIIDATSYSWHWFIMNLPDIIGYTAVGGGVFIILSAMTGRGILKPLGWVFGAFVIAACILGGV